jgi:hypothetical protein
MNLGLKEEAGGWTDASNAICEDDNLHLTTSG